jgi:hypothetical protein
MAVDLRHDHVSEEEIQPTSTWLQRDARASIAFLALDLSYPAAHNMSSAICLLLVVDD